MGRFLLEFKVVIEGGRLFLLYIDVVLLIIFDEKYLRLLFKCEKNDRIG